MMLTSGNRGYTTNLPSPITVRSNSSALIAIKNFFDCVFEKKYVTTVVDANTKNAPTALRLVEDVSRRPGGKQQVHAR